MSSEIGTSILNDRFLSISALASPDPKNHPSISTIVNNVSSSAVFNYTSVTESTITDFLKSLNIRKATGCDLIPPRALKEGYPSLGHPICSLINQLIMRKEIPSTWKHGEVFTVLQKW